MRKIHSTFRTFSLLLIFCLNFQHTLALQANAADKPYYHLVILSDPHLPGNYLTEKEKVIQAINAWQDVDLVAVLGDICESSGTAEEYAAAKKYFAKLNAPLYPVAGNHDYIYEDHLNVKGNREKAAASIRESKLKKIQETFGLVEVFYSKRVGNYLLVFLSTDHLSSDNLTEMSDRELTWLRTELDKNKTTPTIIFFHAPLQDTLRNYSSKINSPSRIAQPAEVIHTILVNNPQVFLWVSGHTHTSPKEESFASPINVYAKLVTNIHNTDMNRQTIYTNSLYLYPGKVVVKTYNHKKSAWLPELQRTVQLPALPHEK